ncbi:MAG: hypothetical protein HYX92_11790 [Chloroflexi bacterium]|nr:hypothetical protein [Chloroflexota bacterium]
MDLRAKRYDVVDPDAFLELAYEQRWTDGLPVAPPTEEKVTRILQYLKVDPQESLGTVAPRHGEATMEKIAINCAMAGCKLEYTPVVIAALKAMLEEPFNLNGVQCTTHSVTPLTIVSGPIVKELGFNSKDGVYGGGSRANATVGRAVRLIMWNIGKAYPGDMDKATIGHPGKYTYCIAEDADANPWEALHVERGCAPDSSGVTVFGCEAPHSVSSGNVMPFYMLTSLADTMSALGNNNSHVMGQTLVTFCPEATKILKREGWKKQDVKEFLFEKARRRLGETRNTAHDWDLANMFMPKWIDRDDDSVLKPVVKGPEDIHVTVCGGSGCFNSVCPGWGEMGGFAVTKQIEIP